ncbi:hypothetical protein AAFC00_001004 [Neodothiora populina]|uniref:Uncharacterized protein n=1 Tax=Neodothiora populina TaxID=2781224 RepID=A0ABR3PMH1_9PEZI
MAAPQKVALVTAGTAGLGAQIARTFAPDYRVVINYNSNAARASALIEELNQIPATVPTTDSPRFHAIQADVGDKASVNRLVEETIKVMGRLDVVASNAGWTRMTDFMNIDDQVNEDDWDRCYLYNVKSHMWLAYAAKPHLEKTEGVIITTASVAGITASGSSLPYSTTKAALIHMTKGLALICAPKIRVNSVSPGLMLTDWGLSFPRDKIAATMQKSKLKRLATVEDVALQVRGLALCTSMTGQNIVLDGGITL